MSLLSFTSDMSLMSLLSFTSEMSLMSLMSLLSFTSEMSLMSFTSEITDHDRKKASGLSAVTAVVIGIPPLLLAAGSMLSLLNG